MKIHSICVVKNEADIIIQTLNKATEWCDYIYVADNNSDDGTWEKVMDFSKNRHQIITYKLDVPFYEGIRAEVFQKFRANSTPGDWWCRLDADEIYIDNPRDFLAVVPLCYQAVWAASFQYYFTDKDLEQYGADPSFYADAVPVEQKCRYYLNNWTENRFFRDDKRIVWDPNCGWPYLGAIYPKRIRLKHYQYRSPHQIQQRLIARFLADSKLADKDKCFTHDSKLALISNNPDLEALSEIWKERVVSSSTMEYDDHSGIYLMREDLMPQVPRSYFPALENRLRYLKKYLNKRNLKRLIS